MTILSLCKIILILTILNISNKVPVQCISIVWFQKIFSVKSARLLAANHRVRLSVEKNFGFFSLICDNFWHPTEPKVWILLFVVETANDEAKRRHRSRIYAFRIQQLAKCAILLLLRHGGHTISLTSWSCDRTHTHTHTL